MNTKLIKTVGLALFIIGFALFNLSFFISNYELTPTVIKLQITDARKATLFLNETSSILQKEIPSNFEFVNQLHAAFDRVNSTQIKTFEFSQEELDKLTSFNKEKFSITSVDSVFKGADESNTFKRKAFKDYGSWLDGQAINKDQLQNVADNIKKLEL